MNSNGPVQPGFSQFRVELKGKHSIFIGKSEGTQARLDPVPQAMLDPSQLGSGVARIQVLAGVFPHGQ